MSDGYKLILLITLVVLIVVFVPLGFVWSLNILFGFHLDYTMETWAASLIFTGAVSGQGLKLSNKKE